MKNSDKQILHKEIKTLFAITHWMSIDPYTGKVYDSLQKEEIIEGKEKVGVIQVDTPNTDYKQVLADLPILRYN